MTPEEQQAMLAQMLGTVGMGAGGQSLFEQLYPTVEKKVGDTNYYQDRVQVLTDPFSAAMAGYGAMSPDAFNPTFERTLVDAPGQMMLNQWLATPETSAKNLMATLMTDGHSPEAAYNQVAAAAATNPDLAASLPPDEPDYRTGDPIPNSGMRSLYEQAVELSSSLASDPTNVQFDAGTGEYYTEAEVESEIAKQFREAGLPNPNQQYTTDDFTYQGRSADLAAQEQELAQTRDAQTAAMRRLLDAGRNQRRDPFTSFDVPASKADEPDTPTPIEYNAGGNRDNVEFPAGPYQPADPASDFPVANYNAGGNQGTRPRPGGLYSPDDGQGFDDYSAGREMLGAAGAVWNALAPPEIGIERKGGSVDLEASPGESGSLWGVGHPRQGLGPKADEGAMMADYFQAHRDDTERRRRQTATRDWQNQSNQATRDRRQTRMANNDYQADNAAAQAAMIARIQGRTPFNDAIQQRLLGQQIAGF